jgi:hypothetical protein
MELVVFAGLVVVVAALGVGLGMLVARVIQRMTDAADAADVAEASEAADEGPGGDDRADD